jgi:hypothetical protein
LVFEQKDELASIADYGKHNLKVLRKYLQDNYSAIEIEVIIAYYLEYDGSKKSNHISEEKREYFRKLGVTDDSRSKIISRFKKRITMLCGRIIKLRN